MCDLLAELMLGVNAQMFAMNGDKVLAGPFQGMQIPERPPWDDGNSSTKLFGSYEWELQDAIIHAVNRGLNVIINIGCAEGYYAIGLARAMPWVKVYALDLDIASLNCCKDYAERNGVLDRITLWQGCSAPEELHIEHRGRKLYLLDCEGAERHLLDPARCPDLFQADIIVECHDFMVDKAKSAQTITELLHERFRHSHTVEVIEPQLPPLAKFNFPPSCSSALAVLTITEKRPMPTRWLACWAK